MAQTRIHPLYDRPKCICPPALNNLMRNDWRFTSFILGQAFIDAAAHAHLSNYVILFSFQIGRARETIVAVEVALAGRAYSCNLMVRRKLRLLATGVPSSLAIKV